MNKINWNQYKFRASALPMIMTSSRSKSDILSETSKKYLRDVYISEVYGRHNYDATNKYTEKGIACEPDSMDLIEQVTGKFYFKNKDTFQNKFIKGTPDIVIRDKNKRATKVIDAKTSWDIRTYSDVTRDSALKSYKYQLLGYMWLTGARRAEIMYCLVNTPEPIMYDELRRLAYKIPEIDSSEEVTNEVKKNYIFDDIPAKDRLKRIKGITLDRAEIDDMTLRIEAARQYLKGFKL